MLYCDDIQYQYKYFQNYNSPNNHNSVPMYHSNKLWISFPSEYTPNLHIIVNLINFLLSFLKFSDINMTFKDHQILPVLWIRELKDLNNGNIASVSQFSHCHVRLFVTPWTAARQASLSITNSRSLLKLMSIKSVMSSNPLILCCPLLPPSIFPSIGVFFSESAPLIRWPKYWNFSFSNSSSNEYSGLISFREIGSYTDN